MVALFGSLFNEINLIRNASNGEVSELIKVPLTYSPKDKLIERYLADPNIDRKDAISLPVMAFEWTGMYYDGARKLSTVGKVFHTDRNIAPNRRYQFNPVPYNFTFDLNIYVKNTEDGTTILEQILPYFTPDYTATVHLIPEMNITHDIPVVLDKVMQKDNYDNNWERRVLIWTLSFTIQGFLYGPVKQGAVILYAIPDIYFINPDLSSTQVITSNTTPESHIVVQPGLTANGQPTSNISLSISPQQILANSDYGFITTIVDK